MSGLSLRTITHKTIDLTASVTLMGYEESGKASGTVSILIREQVIHSQPLNIEGDTSEETVKDILDTVLKEFRQTDKHQEIFKHFKSIAKEFYPIFNGNDPFMVLEMHKPGFLSLEEIRDWASEQFPEGEEYAVLNEFGQVCAWEKVGPKKSQ